MQEREKLTDTQQHHTRIDSLQTDRIFFKIAFNWYWFSFLIFIFFFFFFLLWLLFLSREFVCCACKCLYCFIWVYGSDWTIMIKSSYSNFLHLRLSLHLAASVHKWRCVSVTHLNFHFFFPFFISDVILSPSQFIFHLIPIDSYEFESIYERNVFAPFNIGWLLVLHQNRPETSSIKIQLIKLHLSHLFHTTNTSLILVVFPPFSRAIAAATAAVHTF